MIAALACESDGCRLGLSIVQCETNCENDSLRFLSHLDTELLEGCAQRVPWVIQITALNPDTLDENV